MMKKAPLISLVLSVVATAAVLGANDQPAPQEIIAQSEQLTENLRKALEEKIAATDAAITRAAKAGTLKTSTEAYFRDALEHFRSPEGRLPEWDKLYYPPRFDTSEEMEPINLAWADLRREVTRVQEEGSRISQQLLKATADAIEVAARTAEKPDDLATAEQLIAAYRKQPEMSRLRYYSTSGNSPFDTLARVAAAMREALEANLKQDFGRFASALQRFNQGSNSVSFSDSRAQLSFRSDSILEEFRTRMAAPHLRAAQEAQRELEKLLMARKPAAELDRALAEFEVKAGTYDKIGRDPRTPGFPGQDGFQAAVRAYRTVADSLVSSERGEENARPKIDLPSITGPYVPSTEFRAFASNLSTEFAKQQRIAREKAEEERRNEMAEAEKQRQVQEMESRVREQQQAQERQDKAVEAAREKLRSVRTPQEVLTLADQLPRLLIAPVTSRTNEDFGTLQQFQQVQQELRKLAAWWLEAEVTSDSSFSPSELIQSGYEHPFVAELKTLRERALRDVIVSRFKTPELRESPMAEMNAREAVELLASQAADRGDWKRSIELLLTLRTLPEGRGLAGRIEAIRVYLTGLNFEQGHLFREAIHAYQSVLEYVGDHAPLKEAAARLKELRSTQPGAFENTPGKDANAAPQARPEVPLIIR